MERLLSIPFLAACVQMNSGPDVGPNVETARALIGAAREAGADLICLPEMVAMMEPDVRRRREKAAVQASDPALAAFRDIAAETGAWLLIGSLAVKTGGGSMANRSFLIDDGGGIAAHYDKIHMFDVDLDGGESYRESDEFQPGTRARLAQTPWGGLGMTVCYDLRFPHLYRALASAGAHFLSVPSAFTRTTGRDHWHVLLRARAIETGAFVLAPAQVGGHAGGRRTFGHSLIVDPWGQVLADGGEDVGFVTALIDPAQTIRARRRIPSLTHGRSLKGPVS
jgi:predicted amidohydrolase